MGWFGFGYILIAIRIHIKNGAGKQCTDSLSLSHSPLLLLVFSMPVRPKVYDQSWIYCFFYSENSKSNGFNHSFFPVCGKKKKIADQLYIINEVFKYTRKCHSCLGWQASWHLCEIAFSHYEDFEYELKQRWKWAPHCVTMQTVQHRTAARPCALHELYLLDGIGRIKQRGL